MALGVSRWLAFQIRKCPILIGIFLYLEEGIDDESFPLLDEETILKIFPKAGPRLIFKKKFEDFKHQAPDQAQPIVLAQVKRSEGTWSFFVLDFTTKAQPV